MYDVLVVNALPLIFLGNAGHLDLLRVLGSSRVVVPEPVLREVSGGGHTDAAVRALSAARWIEQGAKLAVPHDIVAWDLGPGESSVIATAREMPGAYAVIDDALGRKCALALGVGVIGTVGLVVAAQRREVIADTRAVLLELRTAGMWLSDDVIARALRIAGIES